MTKCVSISFSVDSSFVFRMSFNVETSVGRLQLSELIEVNRKQIRQSSNGRQQISIVEVVCVSRRFVPFAFDFFSPFSQSISCPQIAFSRLLTSTRISFTRFRSPVCLERRIQSEAEQTNETKEARRETPKKQLIFMLFSALFCRLSLGFCHSISHNIASKSNCHYPKWKTIWLMAS